VAISDVDIANLALTKLGAQPIVNFSDNNPRAAAINRTFYMLRDDIQRRRWNFNRVYRQLPALATAPPFEYQYAYELPADYLRLELASQVQPSGAPPPGQVPFAPPTSIVGMPGVDLSDYQNGRVQDYRIVGLQIWSNIPPPLSIIYGKRETDPNKYDSFFVKAFATYIAWQLCETITNSNAKKDALEREFGSSIYMALNGKAIELPPERIPDDTWMLARIGS
jgi:hypothetical protein